jgi:6-phosphogluconolactonase (cycloisomerase 2 family)
VVAAALAGWVCASSALGFGVVAGSPFVGSPEIAPEGAAFSPSGALLALAYNSSPGYAGSVQVFSVNQTTGSLTESMESPEGWGDGPVAAAFSPNGAFLAIANAASGGPVDIYAVHGTEHELVPIGHFGENRSYKSVAFSPDGKLLAATLGTYVGAVAVFEANATTGELTEVAGSPFATGGEGAQSVAFSPTGALLATTNYYPGSVSVFSVNDSTGALKAVSGSPFKAGGVSESGATSVVFSPNGKLLATANQAGGQCFKEDPCVATVSLFSVNGANGQLSELSTEPVGSQFEFRSIKPRSVAFSPDGKLLAAADEAEGPANGALSVFSVGAEAGSLEAIAGSPFLLQAYAGNAVAFSPSAPLLAVGGYPGAWMFSTLAAPEASVQYPASGGTYARGGVVRTEFACSDGEGAPGVESCRDSNGASSSEGGLLETVTLGSHTYTVISKSKDGQTHSTTISYTVVEPKGPEFGRCVKVPAEKEGKKTVYRGWFTASTCLVRSGTRTSKYEWLPGAVKPDFTVRLKAESKATLITAITKAKVTCTGGVTVGVIASGTTVQNTYIDLTGCTSGVNKCTTPGQVDGELTTRRLEGTLGIERTVIKGGKETRYVGLDLYPVGKTPTFLEYTCGTTSTKLTGSLIGPMSSGKAVTTATVKYAATGGIQKPEAFEGGVQEVLSNGIDQVGLTSTGTQTNEEAIEINPAA